MPDLLRGPKRIGLPAANQQDRQTDKTFVRDHMTAAEIEELAATAGAAMQELQHHLGRDDRPEARVQFPRGFLRTAHYWRTKLPFIRRTTVRNNVAYTLMLNDVHLWLLRRTDIGGTARDMIVKASITALGSVAEAILRDHFDGIMGARQSFASRAGRLVTEGIIDSALESEICWLWDMRNRQHLFELSGSEFDFYDMSDQLRAVTAVAGLVRKLREHHEQAA
jgi:hypothetical protein